MSAAAVTSTAHARKVEELGEMVRAYSELTEKLQDSHAQLQRTVQSLRNDLAEKNRQLERRNRLAALGEMAAGMAHEIRNPLGGIQLYASLLAKDLSGQAEPLKLVGKITSGVKRLEGLVSQVLQFTRQMTPTLVQADVAEVMDESVELAANRFRQMGIHCDSAGPRPLRRSIDPLLLGQAILNLLVNAAEAMGGPGTITLRWSAGEEDARTKISIRDGGPGVPPALLDKIFNPFFTTKEEGCGLGLAIVHRIVEAHDGTISVSNPPGGGALFEIRL